MDQNTTTIGIRKSAAEALQAYAAKQKQENGTAAHMTYTRVIEAGIAALKKAKAK